jgi:phosphatidylglycerophosphate synthase
MKIIDIIRTAIRNFVKSLAPHLNRLSGGKITPNMITTVGLWAHLPIALLIGGGHFVIAAILLVVFGLFDTLDGELARLQKKASTKGMLLDATTDRLKEMLLYAGFAYYIANGETPAWAFVTVVALGASMTTSYAKAKGEVVFALEKHATDHHSVNRHFKEALVPFEIRMVMLIVGLLTGQIIAVSIIIAMLSLVSVQLILQSINRQLGDGPKA